MYEVAIKFLFRLNPSYYCTLYYVIPGSLLKMEKKEEEERRSISSNACYLVLGSCYYTFFGNNTFMNQDRRQVDCDIDERKVNNTIICFPPLPRFHIFFVLHFNERTVRFVLFKQVSTIPNEQCAGTNMATEATASNADPKKSEEEEEEEDYDEPYASHINELKRRREEIESGRDEVLLERTQEYDRSKSQKIKEARLHRNYQIKYCEALYKAQEQEAEDLFNEAKSNIQNEMLSAVNEEIFRYTGKRDGGTDGELRVSTRNLRSKALKEEEEAAKTKKKSKYGNGEDAPIDFALKHKDIAKDLKSIHKDWQSNSKRFHDAIADLPTPSVRVEHGHLHVKPHGADEYTTFYPGVRVILTSEFTGEQFQGTMTSVNAVELYVRLLDESKTRVYLRHIRNGRVTISIDSFGTASSSDNQK